MGVWTMDGLTDPLWRNLRGRRGRNGVPGRAKQEGKADRVTPPCGGSSDGLPPNGSVVEERWQTYMEPQVLRFQQLRDYMEVNKKRLATILPHFAGGSCGWLAIRRRGELGPRRSIVWGSPMGAALKTLERGTSPRKGTCTLRTVVEANSTDYGFEHRRGAADCQGTCRHDVSSSLRVRGQLRDGVVVRALSHRCQ